MSSIDRKQANKWPLHKGSDSKGATLRYAVNWKPSQRSPASRVLRRSAESPGGTAILTAVAFSHLESLFSWFRYRDLGKHSPRGLYLTSESVVESQTSGQGSK